jgi:ABC-type proline/glycine betaine transport system permease subunit
MARKRGVQWFFDPLISIGFPMPKIAFVPIFILWFDIYDTSKVIMITFSCFFPIVTATYSGTSHIDKWPLWSARSLGASENQLLREIILPLAAPSILTGLQIALPVGMITTIVTEMLMGGSGVGGAMIAAGRFADSVGVFAGIMEIAILGMVVIRALEQRDGVDLLSAPKITTLSGRQAHVEVSDVRTIATGLNNQGGGGGGGQGGGGGGGVGGGGVGNNVNQAAINFEDYTRSQLLHQRRVARKLDGVP